MPVDKYITLTSFFSVVLQPLLSLDLQLLRPVIPIHCQFLWHTPNDLQHLVCCPINRFAFFLFFCCLNLLCSFMITSYMLLIILHISVFPKLCSVEPCGALVSDSQGLCAQQLWRWKKIKLLFLSSQWNYCYQAKSTFLSLYVFYTGQAVFIFSFFS